VYTFERKGMRILGPMKENNSYQIKKTTLGRSHPAYG
jgi:hypothetical protein